MVCSGVSSIKPAGISSFPEEMVIFRNFEEDESMVGVVVVEDARLTDGF